MFERLILWCVIQAFIGWLFCDIDKHKYYTWYYGVWHGLFFVQNWLRSWFVDSALCKVKHYSTGYNLWWWIFTILSLPTNIALFRLLNLYVLYCAERVVSEKKS